jgi:hypothetical protein
MRLDSYIDEYTMTREQSIVYIVYTRTTTVIEQYYISVPFLHSSMAILNSVARNHVGICRWNKPGISSVYAASLNTLLLSLVSAAAGI